MLFGPSAIPLDLPNPQTASEYATEYVDALRGLPELGNVSNDDLLDFFLRRVLPTLHPGARVDVDKRGTRIRMPGCPLRAEVAADPQVCGFCQEVHQKVAQELTGPNAILAWFESVVSAGAESCVLGAPVSHRPTGEDPSQTVGHLLGPPFVLEDDRRPLPRLLRRRGLESMAGQTAHHQRRLYAALLSSPNPKPAPRLFFWRVNEPVEAAAGGSRPDACVSTRLIRSAHVSGATLRPLAIDTSNVSSRKSRRKPLDSVSGNLPPLEKTAGAI